MIQNNKIYDRSKIIIEVIKKHELKECCFRLFQSDFGKTYYPTYKTVLEILKKHTEKIISLLQNGQYYAWIHLVFYGWSI